MRISDWSSDVCSSDLNPRMADGPAIVGLRCSMAPPEFCDRTLTDPHGVRHPCPTDGRLPEAGGTSRAFARSPFTTTPQMGDHGMHMIARGPSPRFRSIDMPDHRPLDTLFHPPALITVVLAGEALALMLALASGQAGTRMLQFGLMSLGIQWIAVGTLCALYLLHRPLSRLPSSTLAWACLGLLLAMTLLVRSEEHTSELQSLMLISYAGLCLDKKTSA